MRRALIIEKLPCHHEIIPTWVWMLSNKLGYTVDILVRAPAHRDITKMMSVNMGLIFRLVNTANVSDYDVVINNSLTMENATVCCGKRLTLNVVHSLPFPSTTQVATQVATCLGPHVHKSLMQTCKTPSILVPPVYFGFEGANKSHRNRRTFVVQGVLERFRRNYDMIPKLIDENVAVEITLLGDGRDDKLLQYLRSRCSTRPEAIRCNRNADYQTFFAEIQRSGWVLPLVDNSFQHGYFTKKITSSVMVAIGTGTPMVMHSKLAEIYGLIDGDTCLTYNDNEEDAAFKRALHVSEFDYQRMEQCVLSTREMWLTTGFDSVRALLQNI